MNIAVKKQYQNFKQFSRYSITPIYYNTLDRKYFGGITQWLSDETPYETYEVQIADTYDSIALRYYGNPTFYWVITDFNRIHNPFEKPVPGSIIKVPNFSKIEFQ